MSKELEISSVFDPSAEVKPSLIDLEPLWGNRAEGESHRERLSEREPKGYATVRHS